MTGTETPFFASESADSHSPVPRSATTPSVTVIVPVRNEERHSANTLDQLFDQCHEGIAVELLVVDGRSTDGIRYIVSSFAQRYSQVRLLNNLGLLSSSARNVTIDQSLDE